MTQTKKNNGDKKIKIGIIAVFATVAIILATVLIITFANKTSDAVEYTVYLEGTKGFSIVIDENSKVKSVSSKDEFAFAPEYESYVGTKLNDTAVELVDALCNNNVVTKKHNAILISVEGGELLQNLEIASDLMTLLYFGIDNVDLAVIVQPIGNKDNETVKAEANNISLGKQVLIDRILNQNNHLCEDELVSLNFEELSLLGHLTVNNITTVYQLGAVYQDGYIALATAQTKALNDCGASFSTATNMNADLDVENGILVYEIDFDFDGFEYEYIINAKDAGIVDKSKEQDADYEYQKEHKDEEPQANGYIGTKAAKAKAFESIGLTEDKVTDLEIELEHTYGLIVYEIEFDYDEYEMEILVNAKTGEIVKYTKTYNND